MSNEDLDFVKTRTKLSSYRNYNNNVLQHLSKEELLALQNLRKNKNIIIQKSDKGNSVVTVDKADCLDKMENLLNDTRKSKEWWNFEICCQARKTCWQYFLKNLLRLVSISEETRKSLKTVGTRPGIMYGLCKVYKDIIDNCTPFQLILSAINTPTYKLAKFLVPISNL